MWILPTKGRPAQIVKFFEQWRRTGASTPGIVVLNHDEPRDPYEAVALPPNWTIITTTATCVADAVNQALIATPRDQGDWVGLLCDDLWPETAGWDTKLIAESKPWNIVASANGSQEKRLHGALVYGAALVRAVGWMYPPGIKHSFHDDAWELLGNQCLNVVKASEVMVRHVHAGTVDETGRKRNAYWNADEKAWLRWRQNDAPEAVKRITALMRECGVKVDAPDMSEKSLLIMSPCYSGAYKRTFLFSLQKTLDLLRALNIKVSFEDAPNIAEPGFARSLMFGRFYRSQYTHYLQIDDDMGWDARTVLRMLAAPHDLIAVAGPRKLEVAAVAAHITHEDSRSMLIDQGSGAISVSEVGGAFLMITRACADRMVAAYPDLAFDSPHGAVEHDMFQNLIVNREGSRTRLSEDYAFCHRARRIGIRTMVFPDVALEHVGEKTWSCALNDIAKNAPPQAAD